MVSWCHHCLHCKTLISNSVNETHLETVVYLLILFLAQMHKGTNAFLSVTTQRNLGKLQWYTLSLMIVITL